MKVLRYVHEIRAQSGETVVKQGEDGQDLYLVIDGTLDVSVDGVVVTSVKPGDHFGEIALVRGQRRTAEVVVRESARLFRISRQGFSDLCEKDRNVAIKVLWAFTQSLAKRVVDLSQDVVDQRRSRSS